MRPRDAGVGQKRKARDDEQEDQQGGKTTELPAPKRPNTDAVEPLLQRQPSLHSLQAPGSVTSRGSRGGDNLGGPDARHGKRRAEEAAEAGSLTPRPAPHLGLVWDAQSPAGTARSTPRTVYSKPGVREQKCCNCRHGCSVVVHLWAAGLAATTCASCRLGLNLHLVAGAGAAQLTRLPGYAFKGHAPRRSSNASETSAGSCGTAAAAQPPAQPPQQQSQQGYRRKLQAGPSRLGGKSAPLSARHC